MTTWPNWVDLIVIIILARTCYSGFGRGLWTELLHLVGAVSATALTINYAGVATEWIRPWLRVNPVFVDFVVFWVLFLSAILACHVIIRRIAEIIKWERFHWSLEGIGLVLGGLRGLWWSGFIIIALTSSGFTYLQESVEQRSVLGPRLLAVSLHTLEQVTERFPGAKHRGKLLLPPAKQTASVT